MTITNIYRQQYMKDTFEYRGTLRNEFKFDMFQYVLLEVGRNSERTLIRVQIVGIESTVSDNPDFVYKVRIPNDVAQNYEYRKDIEKGSFECSGLFTDYEDAKKRAKEHLDSAYKLQYKEIENFFKQFNP